MHQKLPFGDLKSKHFLGRGTAPPQTFPPVTLPQTLLLLRPFPHTAPRLRRLDSRACCARPRPSGLDVPHPHNIFTPHSSFSRSMPVKFSSVFSESQFLYFVYCFFDQNATTGAKVKVDQQKRQESEWSVTRLSLTVMTKVVIFFRSNNARLHQSWLSCKSKSILKSFQSSS